ncbi:MAG: RimK family alpha-L-glutamate ligase [Patescibacteria group bacterium]
MLIHVLTFGQSQKLGESLKGNMALMENAATKLGHQISIIFENQCYMKFGNSAGLVLKNHELKDVNVLIVRANPAGANMMFRSTLIRQFELLGIPVVNKELGVMRAKNKIKTLQVLTRKNVPVPRSFIVTNSANVDEIVSEIGSFPVILKAVSGSQGKGVSIIESKRGLRSVIEMVVKDQDPEPLIIQEYVKESKGHDLRVFVIGKKIVGAMERIAKKRGEFRSNFHLGGRVRIADLSDDEKKLALDAARACGLDFAGVDILRTKTGPKVLEVNANPGLEGITHASGRDIAGEIIKYAVKKSKRFKNRKNK